MDVFSCPFSITVRVNKYMCVVYVCAERNTLIVFKTVSAPECTHTNTEHKLISSSTFSHFTFVSSLLTIAHRAASTLSYLVYIFPHNNDVNTQSNVTFFIFKFLELFFFPS